VPSKLRVAFWKFRQRRRRRARRGQVKTPALVMSGSEPTATGSSAAKDVKDIYIFAMIPYYDIGGGQRAAQLAKTFNKMGYAVHYIYAFPSSDTGKRDPFVPAVRHVYAKDLTPADVVANLQGEPIFIFEAPYKDYEPYLDLADKLHAKTIYEHIDNWESSIGSLFYSERVFRKFLNRCDILVATTQLLAQRMSDFMRQDPELARKADEVIYVPNAVDTDLFDPMRHHQRPHDLSSGTPTLLYFGSLWGEWFDWELIRQVARQVPGCSINLIGDYSPIASLAKTLPPNVHFLGPKLQPELPAYLEHCDITLLPFKNDDIGKYVSPLKVFEYTAMDKPVLATHLPDIQGYPKVFTSDSALDWVRVVRGEIPLESAATNAFSSANNWYTRCNQLLDSIEAGVHELPRDQHISIVILNHNNRGVIERCIDSMLQFRDRYGYEIIVVDNQSSDGSYELLQDRYADHILLIRNTRNGCSSGRNLGIQRANGNLLLFVDSDQWAVSQRWLDTPLTVLERHRNIGAVGWTCGWFDPDMVGGPIAPDLPHGGIEPAQVYRSDIAYLGSGGMLVRREALSGSRSFDEAYDPTCYEDTDLSLQIRDQGYDLAYCPYMNLNHLPHQTTRYGSDSHWKLVERNGAYFEHKWRKRNPRLLQFYLH
jgi:GT2 family glycosyltransferase/glycosyltransferase involved in cell wall biosynthesis